MTLNRFQSSVQSKVLLHLESGPKTLRELEELTQYQYYSVRKAVVSLEALGTVRPTGPQARNKKYMLGENPNQLGNIIPTINDGDAVHKANVLLNLRHSGKTLAEDAITALPRNVARIFNFALRLDKGLGVPEVSVENLRSEMKNSLKALQKVVTIYEQLLLDERFWDTKYLARMHKDYDFNEAEIVAAYEHYYGSTDD